MPVGDDLDFQTRYRVLRSTSSNSRFRTHAALEQRSGRAVMVHMVDGADQKTIDRIREQVAMLPPAEAHHVLELATIPSGFAVVTEFIQGLAFFSEWLDEKSAAGALSATAKPRASSESDGAKQPPELAPTVVIRAPVSPPPAAETKVAGGSVSSSAPTVVRPAVKTAAPPPPAEPTAPVERTPTPVASPDTAVPDKSPPGEYTRIFKMGGTPAGGSPAVVPPSSPAATHGISETPPRAGEAPGGAAASHVSADRTPAPPPVAEIPDAKPGEYTQIFGARSAPQPSRGPQPPSLSPLGDSASKSTTPPANERTSGGGATGAFGVWGDPAPSASSDFGFGRSEPHSASALPRSSFPPISPSSLPPSVPSTPPIPPAPSAPAPSSIPAASFGAGAIPVGGLSPLLQGPPANLPTQSPLSGRGDDAAQRNTPAVPSLPAVQAPAFGVGLPPLPSLGDSLDSPFAKPSAPKAGGGYTQINKSVTPAPPPAVAAPQKVVASKREGFRLPTALVVVIAVVVILAITLILYFALRAPVRPVVTPATNGAASSATSSPQQTTPATTPATTPVASPTTTPPKDP